MLHQIAFGPAGQHEGNAALVDDLARSGDAFHRQLDVIERRVAIAGEVLDARTGQPTVDRLTDGLGHVLGTVAEAVLQVAVDGHRNGLRQHAVIGQRLFEAQLIDGIAAPFAPVDPGAAGADGLEAGRRQDTRGTNVPGVGHDEGALATMQLQKSLRLGLEIRCHADVPFLFHVKQP